MENNKSIDIHEFINHLNYHYNAALKRCSGNYSVYYMQTDDLNLVLLQYKDLSIQQEYFPINDLQLNSTNGKKHLLSFSVPYGYNDGIILNKNKKEPIMILDSGVLTINLFNLDEDLQKKKLLAGNKNGESFIKDKGVKDFDKINKIKLYVPEDIVISSSFFVGMFNNFYKKFKNLEEIYSSIEYNDKPYVPNKIPELQRSIMRCFSNF